VVDTKYNVRTLLAMSDSLVTIARFIPPNDHHCMRLIFAEPLYISLGAVKIPQRSVPMRILRIKVAFCERLLGSAL